MALAIKSRAIRDDIKRILNRQDVVMPETNGTEGTVAIREPRVFVLEDVLDRLGDDYRLLIKLFGWFRAAVPNDLAAIRSFAEAGDCVGLRRAAHALRGACANLSGERAVLAAERIETMGDRGDIENVDAAVADLAAEIATLLECLSKVPADSERLSA